MELFPPPDKSGSIKFLMAKSLPYPRRIALVAGLMAAGLGVQLAASFWAGLALLAAASLLGMAEGYDARPKTAGDRRTRARTRMEAKKRVFMRDFPPFVDRSRSGHPGEARRKREFHRVRPLGYT